MPRIVKKCRCKNNGQPATSPLTRSRLDIPLPPRAPRAARRAVRRRGARCRRGAACRRAPRATALRLAEAKARAVAARHADALIIGSDQVADLDGRPIGKPGDHADAFAQLRALSGQTVVFHTGVALLRRGQWPLPNRLSTSPACFACSRDAEIDSYLRARAALRLRRSVKLGSAGHRVVRAYREQRSVGADRPAADPPWSTCCGPQGWRCSTASRDDDHTAPDVVARHALPRAEPARRRRPRSRCCRRARSRSRGRSAHWRRRNAEAGARVSQDLWRSTPPHREPRRRGDARARDGGCLRGAACAGARGRGRRRAVRCRLPGRRGSRALRWSRPRTRARLRVVPLVGPSALLLALMASGMNGQRFAFHGYLPVKPDARAGGAARARTGLAQRNGARRSSSKRRIATSSCCRRWRQRCGPRPRLCVAADLTLAGETIERRTSREWRDADLARFDEAAGDLCPAGAGRTRRYWPSVSGQSLM